MNYHLLRNKIFLLLALLSLQTYSQSPKPKDSLPNAKHQLKIGVHFSPDLCYRILKSDDTSTVIQQAIKDRNNFEINGVGFTSGIDIEYSINKLISITSGLQFANKRYQTQELSLHWGSNLFGPPSTYLLIYNHYYLEIPFQAKVNYTLDKFKFNFGIGLAPGLFIRHVTAIDHFDNNNNLSETKSTNNSGFNAFNLSLLGNIGFNYAINKKST